MAQLEITLRDVEPYEDVIKEEVRKKAEKLDRLFAGILNTRVVVEVPHRHRKSGNLYRATIELNVPDKQIVVSREHPQSKDKRDIFIALRHAFDAAVRQLEEYSRARQGDVKDHDLLPHGVVSKLHSDEGFGFIESFGGREIYFHKNSALDGFENLAIGDEVRFEEEMGEKGPQASSVKILRKEHVHHRRH
jgi:cold shock CspA family protein